MLRILLLAVLWLAPLAGAAQTLTRVGMPDGRYYLLATPSGTGGHPLIVALHGGGGSPEQFARSSGLTRAALSEGFAIAYPAGTSRKGGPFLVWNALYCCGYASAAGTDDIGFLEAVIDDASGRVGAAGEAYVTGMSNGAMMAQTFAALRPDRVAALATVSGTMDAGRVAVRRATPFLHIHGTADEMVPYGGGRGTSSLTQTDFASVQAVVAAFLRPFGSLSETRSIVDPSEDGTRVIRTTWADRTGPRIVLLTVENGAHVWPGGRRARGKGATHDIDASEEIVRFFAGRR